MEECSSQAEGESQAKEFQGKAPTLVKEKDIPKRAHFAFDPIQDALVAFKRGEFLVVMDDERRENEGDLICAACMCTTEKKAWLIKHTRSVHFCHSFGTRNLYTRFLFLVVTSARPSQVRDWKNWISR